METNSKRNSILTVTNIIVFTALVLSVAALVLSSGTKNYTETLFSSNLNDATLKQASSLQLLYSYPLNSGDGGKSGFFTVVLDGPSAVPNISFEVRDQLDRKITTGTTTPGKITRVHFQGEDNSTAVNLYILPRSGNIVLESLTINLS
jgi:hypothetical protein